MTNKMVKKLLDTCFLAKKITEMMPELPKGLKPRHIHIITSIAERSEIGEPVRVSEVSSDLKVTMPSVTKLINELTALKIITKYSLQEDKRVAALSLTELGKQYYNIYVTDYHGQLIEELSTLKMEDCKTMIATVELLHQSVERIAKEGF